jgi:hypothetical protein
MLPSLTALCCSSSCPRPYLIHKHARETCHTHTGTGRSRGRISLGRRPRRRRLRLAHNCVAEAVELGHLLVHLCLRHLSRQASMSCAPKHVMSAHHERPSPCRALLAFFFLVSAALSTCLQNTHAWAERGEGAEQDRRHCHFGSGCQGFLMLLQPLSRPSTLRCHACALLKMEGIGVHESRGRGGE